MSIIWGIIGVVSIILRIIGEKKRIARKNNRKFLEHNRLKPSWYLGLAAPIHFMIGISILYNKTYKVCNKISNIIYDRLVTEFTNFRALLRVNYSL